MANLKAMTAEELTALKAETYDTIREQHRAWDRMSMADPRWTALNASLKAGLKQYHRIDDELNHRGA